jgi:hypothetical protein
LRDALSAGVALRAEDDVRKYAPVKAPSFLFALVVAIGLLPACGNSGDDDTGTGSASGGTGATSGTGNAGASGDGAGGSGMCVATGEACALNGDCCSFTESSGFCVNYDGQPRCYDGCTDDADCASNCCALLSGGVRACAPAELCTDCVATGHACSVNGDCCSFIQSNGACVGAAGGSKVCSDGCKQNSDCASKCCAELDNADYVCAPSSVCN